MRELHQWPSRGMTLLGDLAVEPVEDRPPVAQRAVTDAERLLTAGEQIGDELVDGTDAGGATCCTPPGTWRYIA